MSLKKTGAAPSSSEQAVRDGELLCPLSWTTRLYSASILFCPEKSSSASTGSSIPSSRESENSTQSSPGAVFSSW
jgi:hypothetical protein